MQTMFVIDLIFGTNIADLKGSSIAYIENLKERMAWAYETANDVIKNRKGTNNILTARSDVWS